MRIVVIGAGGVGGYFGAKLAKAGAEVTFVARGAHLKAIQDHGLRVRSAVEGEWTISVPASDATVDLPIADLVVISVKSFDTEAAAALCKPVVGPDTAVLSLQNGIDNEDKLASILGAANVLGGIAYVFSNIEAPGVITHHQLGRIVFGERTGARSHRATGILELFQKAAIAAELSENIEKALWEKYVFQTALGGTVAVTRLPVRYVQELKAIRKLWRLQVEELLMLAKRAGIEFDEDMVSRYVRYLESLSPTNYSSIFQDLVSGKRLELEAFHGHALKLADRHRISTPTIFAVYAALFGYVNGRPAV